MQDRFKFRYFNKYANKMVEPTNYENVDSVFECIKQQVCFDSNISPLPYDHIGNGLIFMQCTGLKDKNGKLIYEGDIVRDEHSEAVAIIEWLSYAYSLMAHIRRMDDYFPLEDICFACEASTPFEVIGNIYENPELLEVSNDN